MTKYLAFILALLVAMPAFADRTYTAGSTSRSAYIRIIDDTTGALETGVTAATSGLDLEYLRMGGQPVDITESDLAATDSAYSSGGIKHVGGGRYRVDVPNAALVAGVPCVDIQGTCTGMNVIPETITLTTFDLQTALQSVNATLIAGDASAAANLKQGYATAPPLPADLAAINAMYYVAGVGQYDATSNGNLIANSGGLIARWEDQSGNARHLTQSTSGNRPMYDPVSRTVRGCEGYDHKMTVNYVGNRNATSVVIFAEIPSLRRPYSTGTVGGTGGLSYLTSFESLMYLNFGGGDTLGSGGTPGTLGAYDTGLSYINTPIKVPSRMSMIGYSGGTQYRLFVNEQEYIRSGSITSGNSSSFWLGNSVAHYGFHANIKAVMVFSVELTIAQRNYLLDFGKKHFGVGEPEKASVNVIVEGDSISTGYGANLNGSWGNILASKTAGINYWNNAEASTNAAALSGVASTRVDGLYTKTARNVVFLFAGTNDIVGGTTGAATSTIITNYSAARKSNGAYRTVVLSMLPRGSTYATQRGNLNTALRAAYPTAVPKLGPLVYCNAAGDYLIDVGADSVLAASGDTTNADPNLYADTIHPTDAGHMRLATIVEPVWRELTQSATNAIDTDRLIAAQTSINTIDDFVDTEIGAIKTKTDYLPSATAGATGGVLIAGSNAATTFATLTSTGAFTVNGTSNVSQTGDSFARIGSTGSGLTTLATQASVNTIDDFVDTEVASAVSQTTASAIRTALGLASANLDSQIGDIDAAVSLMAGNVDTILTDVGDVDEATVAALNADLEYILLKSQTDATYDNSGDAAADVFKILSAFELDGAVYRLTTNALEQGGAVSLDPEDIEAIGEAAAAGIDNGAIADAVRTELATELGRIDVTLSSRLPTVSYSSPPSAATVATQVRTELTTELGRLDASVSSRLASGSYTAPPSAATNASAVRTELTTELGRIDVATSTRLATVGYTTPPTAAAVTSAVWANGTRSLTALGFTLDKSATSGFNDVSTAQVQSSAAAALTAYDAATDADLDSLNLDLTPVTDVTEKLDTMLTPEGGGYAFNLAAFSNLPASEVELTPENIQTIVDGVTAGFTISNQFVDDGHTWTFDYEDDLTSPKTLYENTIFDGLVGMSFVNAIPKGTSISGITAVSIEKQVGSTLVAVTDEVELGDEMISPDKLVVHIPIESVEPGEYVFTVTVVTTDSQTRTRKGLLVIQE